MTSWDVRAADGPFEAPTSGRSRASGDGETVPATLAPDHALNRAYGRLTIFEDDADYEAFVRARSEAVDRSTIRLLC